VPIRTSHATSGTRGARTLTHLVKSQKAARRK
jgi:hypothetical protein